MATTYDKASLVMIPSGYKDDKLYSIKPTDGSGDFTFSRDGAGASPATRVNASGLIEKGRENLLTYSNDFSNAAWIKLGNGTGTAASVTSGFSDPDGGSNAWRLQCDLNGGTTSSDQSLIYQSGTGTGVHTYSYYVKSNTGANQTFSFGNDLNGYTQGVATTSWQRFEVFVNSASHTNAYIGARGTTGSDDTLDILVFAAQKEIGLVATDYIETTTAPVSAGLLGDMPRLDYSGGATCPSLLLEPSRVNLFITSEWFGGWDLNAGTTLTYNYATSPEGVQNATRYVGTGASGFGDKFTLTNGAQYTISAYVKSNTGVAQNCRLIGDSSNVSSDIEVTTEWTRIYYTWTSAGLANKTNGLFRDSSDNDIDILVYGLQLESGSYVSSYIPTYVSASTRGADVCNDTTATDVIGQTEGSIFVDFVFDGLSNTNGAVFLLLTANGGGSNRVQISLGSVRDIVALVLNGGVSVGQANTSSSYLVDGTRYKVGVSYSVSGGLVLYINGTLIDTDTLASVPSRDRIHINDFLTTGSYVGALDMKQTLLFKTALTNAELAALTTI